mgnify:FL=1
MSESNSPVSQTEKAKILASFEEWHLDTWFVPFDPDLVIHVARWQGFLGAARRCLAVNVMEFGQRDAGDISYGHPS